MTTEGRTKPSRWHAAPQDSSLPPVAPGFDEPALIPPQELAERIAGQVLVHLLAGRWGLAHQSLLHGEAEARELLGKPDPTAMSVGERRMLHVVEMRLGSRLTNALEKYGLTTVGRVADCWPINDLVGQGIPTVTYRTAIAKVLREWNLLTDDQVRHAHAEGLIDCWWHDKKPVD
jgi:hypothetical protein